MRGRSAAVVDVAMLFIAAAIFLLAATAPQQAAAVEQWAAGSLVPRTERTEPPPWLLPIDDGYIYVRYAQQAARGLPFQWSEGEPSTGASSFVYPFLQLPAHWIYDGVAGWSRYSRGLGALSLFLLGLAAWGLLGALELPRAWRIAGGVAVIWSGPVGYSSIAGMETGLASAAIVAVCALWRFEGRHPPARELALGTLLAILPLLRPELFGLTVVGAGVSLTRGCPIPRRRSLLPLVPAIAVAVLNFRLTGHWVPAGVTAKSWLATAFITPGLLLGQYLVDLWTGVFPVYAGLRGELLWPPVGVLGGGLAVVVLTKAVRRGALPAPLLALVTSWLLLVAAAPASAFLSWQVMRHHQPGLVLCWLLATVGAWKSLGHLAPLTERIRVRFLPLLAVALLAVGLPRWGTVHLTMARALYARHADALDWLSSRGESRLLLVNDAGLPAIAHDGPLIDLVGLGTPGMTRPARHGPGAVVEALARRPALPDIAAVNLDLQIIPPILGPPLVPLRDLERETVLAPVRQGLFVETVLDGPGVDFASLPDEALAGLVLTKPPYAPNASVALVLTGPAGRGGEEVRSTEVIQGCRPLHEAARIDLSGVRGRLVAAALTAGAARVRVSPGDHRAPHRLVVQLELPDDGRWHETEFELSATNPSTHLWIERSGEGLPCLESLRFLPPAAN